MENPLDAVKDIMNRVMNKYDPENDVGIPNVTHTDVQLILIVQILVDKIKALEDEIENLEEKYEPIHTEDYY